MEEFNDTIPTNWNINQGTVIARNFATLGRVHTGASSISLFGHVYQEITNIKEGCFYEFSFFAHAYELDGNRVDGNGYVIFQTSDGPVVGTEISLPQGGIPNTDRNFGYYRAITIAAPNGVTSAIVGLMASRAGTISDSRIDFDDVSFSIR